MKKSKLTKPQSDYLRLLIDAGGYIWTNNAMSLRVFNNLKAKGYCKLTSAYGPGQGQGGTNVILIKK